MMAELLKYKKTLKFVCKILQIQCDLGKSNPLQTCYSIYWQQNVL